MTLSLTFIVLGMLFVKEEQGRMEALTARRRTVMESMLRET